MSDTHVDKLENSLIRHYDIAMPLKLFLRYPQGSDEIGLHTNPYQYDKALAMLERFVTPTLNRVYIKRRATVEKGSEVQVIHH